jgi:hypothetical protein
MRTVKALLGVGIFALALACGDSDPAPAAPPADQGPGEPDPTLGPTTATPDEPATPPVTPPPGTTPPPAPDRLVDVDRLDQDAECDTLVPASVPEPVTVSVSGGSCGRGTSDGNGAVAVEVVPGSGDGPQHVPARWRAFTADGRARDDFEVSSDALFSQPTGWIAATASWAIGQAYRIFVQARASDGSLRSSDLVPPQFFTSWLSIGDPAGGTFLVARSGASRSADLAVRYDAEGVQRNATGVGCAVPLATGCPVVGVGVSTRGDAIVIQNRGGNAMIQWLARDGSRPVPGRDDGGDRAFGTIFGAGPLTLAALLDGSVAVRSGDAWVRRYPHLATAGEAAPGWLAAREGESFRFTRGNRGYAFFPRAGAASGSCRQEVELVAPSGRKCARLTFREDATGCTSGAIDQGWDGTVVQQSGKDRCRYRWWPRLLGE